MQPSMSTFDDPTDLPEATAVGVASPRNAGGAIALVKDASVFVVVVPPVRVRVPRATQRPTSHSADRHDGVTAERVV